MQKNTLLLRVIQIFLAIFFFQNLVQITSAVVPEDNAEAPGNRGDYKEDKEKNLSSNLSTSSNEKSIDKANTLHHGFRRSADKEKTKSHESIQKSDFEVTEQKNSALKTENITLQAEVDRIQQKISSLEENYQALERKIQKQNEESEREQQEYAEIKARRNIIIQDLEKKFTTLAWITFWLCIILTLCIIYISTQTHIDSVPTNTPSDTEDAITNDETLTILEVSTDELNEAVTPEEKVSVYSMGPTTYEIMKNQHFRSTNTEQHLSNSIQYRE